jgi:hypothetical protein
LEPFLGRMGGAGLRGRLEGMTGDFLPQRRQASLLTQLLTVVVIIAVAVGAIYVLT